MIIIYRACETNLSAQSLGSFQNDNPRWNGKYKSEIFKKCFLSLQHGITQDDTIIVAAYCPIPGHATHLQEHCITPIVGWLAYYESINI